MKTITFVLEERIISSTKRICFRLFSTKNLLTDENEVILIIAGGEKLVFYNEVKRKTNMDFEK